MAVPADNYSKLVTFSILVSGRALPAQYAVTDIRVVYEINRIPSASITFRDGRVSDQHFPISDSSHFAPGSEIEIKLGYENNNKTVFKGIILDQSLKISSGSPELTIQCKDKALKLAINRSNGFYNGDTMGKGSKIKDSDVISRILKDHYPGTSKVAETKGTYEQLVKYYATDWDFIVSRAEINGQMVFVHNETIRVAAPAVRQSPAVTIAYGQDIIDLQFNTDTQTQYSAVHSAAWDAASQELVTAKAAHQNTPSQGNLKAGTLAGVLGAGTINLQSGTDMDRAALQSWADAGLFRSQMARLQGYVTFQGNSAVIPDTLIRLKGVGDRFEGNAYVSRVEHEVADGNWLTTAHTGIPETWFWEKYPLSSPPASGLSPGIQSLQIGKVLAYAQDTDNEFRIKVKLPILQDSKNALWARLVNFYATSEKAGFFFIPEAGDEVVVGFLNDDPKSAIVLGALYSKANPAPYEPSETNFTKAIITKGQNKITFDDEKKTIQIITPGGNQLTITDDESGSVLLQDQHNNSVKLSSSGIDLASAGSMNINVQENLSISARGNIALKADGDVEVSGSNVEQSATTNFKASGNLSAELSAQGKTAVNGGLVTIN